MRRIRGEEHPSTISAMRNLAITHQDQVRLDGMAKIQEEVLEKRRRILGDEHPSTIKAMNNLANTLADQGQLDEAAKTKEGSVGEEATHPRRRTSIHDLGNEQSRSYAPRSRPAG
jgi:hypothetical protein